MIKILVISVGLLLSSCSFKSEVKTIKNENVGTISMSVPKDWKATERYNSKNKTSFYNLISKDADFNLDVMFNDTKQMRMDGLDEKNLESYLDTNGSVVKKQEAAKQPKPKRFGKKSDGVYVVLADPNPKAGEFNYYTQGIRYLGNNKVAVFILYSKEDKEDTLIKTLEMMESITIK